jgi:hypothetical protein
MSSAIFRCNTHPLGTLYYLLSVKDFNDIDPVGKKRIRSLDWLVKEVLELIQRETAFFLCHLVCSCVSETTCEEVLRNEDDVFKVCHSHHRALFLEFLYIDVFHRSICVMVRILLKRQQLLYNDYFITASDALPFVEWRAVLYETESRRQLILYSDCLFLCTLFESPTLIFWLQENQEIH